MSEYLSEKDFLHSLQRFNALSSAKYGWHTGVSEKVHRCEFGHEIPADNLYFKKPLDMEGEQKYRVCKDCMTKLVFLTVDSDIFAKELSDQLFHNRHPKRRKLDEKALR